MDVLERIKFLEDQLHRLSEIGMALSTEKDTDRLFEMILEEAKNITRADGRTLYSPRHRKEHVPAAQAGDGANDA